MKLIVDFDRCEANGLCEQFAPEVFHVDENDFLQVDHDNIEDNEDSVQLAVRSCPKSALKLED